MKAKAILLGRVGKDPEVNALNSGSGSLTKVSIATNKKFKNKETGERDERTTWHQVVFFGRIADIAGQYLKKGDLAYIEGEIEHRKVTLKDGTEQYRYSVIGRELEIIPTGNNKGATQYNATAPQHQPHPQHQQAPMSNSNYSSSSDDIPF